MSVPSSDGREDRGGESTAADLRKQDEVLQLLFWMRGEGLGEVVRPPDLRVFLAPEDELPDLTPVFRRLVERGLLETLDDDGPSGPGFRLTEEGILEGGRRFADEFSDIAGQAHGQCDDPDCDCHDDPGAALECHEERHVHGPA